MPSIADLRAALAARAEDAPSVSDILAAADSRGLDRPPAWRHRAVLAVAAAAVVTAVAVPALVASNRHGDRRLSGQVALGPSSSTAPSSTGSPAPSTRARPTAKTGATPATSVVPPAPLSPGPRSATSRATTSSSKPATTTSSTAPPPAAGTGARGPDGPDVATALRYSFQVRPVDGYRVTYTGVVPTAQYAAVAFTDAAGPPVGSVTVYSAGAFDPGPAQDGTPVKVGDTDGFYGRIADQRVGAARGAAQFAVSWPYAPDAWAVVQGDWSDLVEQGSWTGDPEAAEVAIAAAVDPAASTTLLIPMQVTYLPSGTVPESVETGTAPFAVLGLSDGGASDARSVPGPGHGSALQITAEPFDPAADLRRVDDDGNLDVPGGPDIHLGAPVSVPGARAFQDANGNVTAVYDDRVMTVRFTGYGPNRYSAPDMLRMTQGLVPAASTTDETTWFDAATAVR